MRNIQPGIRSNFFRVVEVCKTHGWALEQKTSMPGSNMLGSSNDPAKTSVSPGITSTSATIPEPQFEENWRWYRFCQARDPQRTTDPTPSASWWHWPRHRRSERASPALGTSGTGNP